MSESPARCRTLTFLTVLRLRRRSQRRSLEQTDVTISAIDKGFRVCAVSREKIRFSDNVQPNLQRQRLGCASSLNERNTNCNHKSVRLCLLRSNEQLTETESRC